MHCLSANHRSLVHLIIITLTNLFIPGWIFTGSVYYCVRLCCGYTVCVLRLLLDYGVTLWVGNVSWFTVKAIVNCLVRS